MQIYIKRENEDFGPYSREAVLEYVKQGVFQAYDRACIAGMSEWKPLNDLLGISGAAEPVRAGKVRAVPAPAARVRAAASPVAKVPTAATATAGTVRQPATRRAWVYGQTGEKKRGHMIIVNIVLITVVAGAVYVRMGGGGPVARHYLAEIRAMFGRPDVETTQPASPVSPVIARQPVAPAPLPMTPPRPARPKAFTPAALGSNPSAWPKTLKLKQAANFPAVLDGQTVGSVTVTAGTVVKLVNIQGDQLVLDYQGGTQTLPWRATDLEQRVSKTSEIAPAPADTAPGMESVSPAGN